MSNNNSAFKNEDLYQTLDRINNWIANCDMKTSIAISGLGIVFTVLLSKDYVTKFKRTLVNIQKNDNLNSLIYLIFIVASIIAIGIGCIYLFNVLVPRTKSKLFEERGIQSESLIFFSSIAKVDSYRKFSRKIQRSSEDLLRNDLISQIYICSKICDEKFKNYKLGITFSLIGLLSFIILIVVGDLIT